jgi:hypothetical protein
MGDIIRLPGSGCQHFAGGRCLYEERLNPGYTDCWQCSVLVRWESAFDDFLERAESFGVGQDAIPDLWERQFERMARGVFDCKEYTYSHGAEAPACVYGLDGVCLLSLPECKGRCRRYLVEVEQKIDG